MDVDVIVVVVVIGDVDGDGDVRRERHSTSTLSELVDVIVDGHVHAHVNAHVNDSRSRRRRRRRPGSRPRQRKRQRKRYENVNVHVGPEGIFLLVTTMDLLVRFGRYSVETYGGAPLLLVITLIQASLLGWALAQAWKARADRRAPGLSPDVHRIRAARRAELWEKHVRPLALTMMLLGPGLGLGMSTLLGALGMGALGDAMATQAGAETLAATMASAYREISYAYFLMVGGTFPMLLGPVIVLAARRLDQDGADARGGDPEEVLLHTLKSLLAVTEQQAQRLQSDAARTHALLEATASALSRGRAA